MASKKITTKSVQATEDKPFELPTIPATAEQDTDPWDEFGLTIRQKRFCEAYVSVAAGNASKAAELAGYRCDNRNSLGATASEILKRPNVRGYIGRLLASSAMSVDFLKSRLAQIAQSSLDNCTTIDDKGEVMLDLGKAAQMGALSQIKEISEEVLKATEQTSIVARKVKLHDPSKAIELLLKMHGALTDKVEISGPGGAAIQIQNADNALRGILADPDTLQAAELLASRLKGLEPSSN